LLLLLFIWLKKNKNAMTDELKAVLNEIIEAVEYGNVSLDYIRDIIN